jgi:photosystem II stability/assembly factor-like uncharacterized protein
VRAWHRLAAIVGLAVLAQSCAVEHGGWKEERLPTRAEFRGITFLDPDHGFIVGGNYFIDGGIVGRTSDGGRSWSFTSGLVAAKAGFSLTDLVFVDRFIGVACGTHGVIIRTTDRGQNWHLVRSIRGGTDHFHDLFFLDRQHGWAVGFNGAIQTMDGGETWSWLGERRSVSGSAVHFFSPTEGLVAGKHGRILLTTDGGESWTGVADGQTNGTADLLTMAFVGPANGWAAGAEGTILRTSDRGRSWRRQTSPVTARITDIAFVDVNRGWAVAADRASSASSILSTTDGGETWRVDRVVDGELLRCLTMLDATRGWTTGERPEHGAQALLRYRGN